ncbi:MAG: type transport system ATP-binding protein [Epulopiscium sp.]|jgi:ABC-2 type transport system ATP-binding protein|uniref:ATP-binding cassette domain-containing protein n=1 Tax=Defluviitalea raffinosedens TaxID=1450156 RepID=A0A7C8HI35_9FIRM|nr:ABC transporter ATP-binding protein [Defluviitalea raffinosedens]MBZ4668060.1 bcrA1 [Defluviitaleaceae bacterium]MDK2788453.1 type transport system ATP-binding protein [Candidatus Epulonipiscium sp.]KAE9634089.1 ATP-binding cassette domain-containing protein [Defluviitalea raffinosedens]MBM7686792.1 ABC-2 type transport system ATP-binding protein [Defluviitalea raffinosedens]HHW68033.1 ABC transporter ATP-binding protein [Candidatus Epulonipiscium sp.]
MEYALTLENVTKEYKDFKLDHINVYLPKGCIMGFIGENGAGKSTTIKLIMDLVKRDEGKITILGKDNKTELNSIKENIGVVMNELCFPENLNAREINKIMKKVYKTWDEDQFHSFIQKFSIAESKLIKEYSRGMKMKLAIAVALSHDSKILILDEATSGLDPIVREEILDIFLEFIQDESHSIFVSSHIISDLEKICDYITFIHKGKIVLSEPKDELLERYGILKCTEEEFEQVNPAVIKGVRKNKFGIEALVLKNELKGNYVIDKADIEDIMIFYIKEQMV